MLRTFGKKKMLFPLLNNKAYPQMIAKYIKH